MVTDVSFQTKTEAIELEPRVAKPVQLWEHGAKLGFLCFLDCRIRCLYSIA